MLFLDKLFHIIVKRVKVKNDMYRENICISRSELILSGQLEHTRCKTHFHLVECYICDV
jgi:hypothetical protein